MNLIANNSVIVSVAEEGIDFAYYADAINFFKSTSDFWMQAEYMLPYKFINSPFTITVVGQSDDYTLQVGELKYNFFNTITLALPADSLVGRKIDLTVLGADGSSVGQTSIAFAHYLVFIYIFISSLVSMNKTLDKYRMGRYLLANVSYPDMLENRFGKLASFMRESPLDFLEYQDQLFQLYASFMQQPGTMQGFSQMIGLLHYQGFIEPKLEAWTLPLGYTLLPDLSHWVVDYSNSSGSI